MQRHKDYVSDHAKGMIIILWARGRDTFDIAAALHFHESTVANLLPLLLTQRRRALAGA